MSRILRLTLTRPSPVQGEGISFGLNLFLTAMTGRGLTSFGRLG
jgi:hypothetical protein